MSRLSDEDERKLAEAWSEEVGRRPPTVGVVGVSGVGKSSTINALFKTDLPVSNTVACTKEFTEVPVDVRVTGGPVRVSQAKLVVLDAPGLGEDVRKDPEYIDMYKKNLPSCDVILWITAARNRAIALDQTYLSQLAEFSDRMVFGVSQVDIVEPRNWKQGSLIPSVEQEAAIDEIVTDRATRLSEAAGRRIELTPFSNHQGFNLETLFTSVLEACPIGRKWIFKSLKGVRLEDFIAASAGQRPAGEFSSARQVPGERRRSDPISGLIRSFFGRDDKPGPELTAVMEETLGRRDFESRPLSADELEAVEARLTQQRIKQERKRSR